MYSVEELFRNLGGSTTNDFMIFRKWLSNKIIPANEVGQLEWILNNPEITDRTKWLLTGAIAKQSSAIDDEKSTLLKVGNTTDDHRGHIEETKKRVEEQCSRTRIAFFGMAGAFTLVFSIICANYNGNSKDLGAFMSLAMLFFGLAVVCLTQAWNASSEIKDVQAKALQLENESVGRDLQTRIAAIEKEEKRLFELNKVIVKSSAKNAETDNTSVA